jgi:hypothetical protein
LFVFNDDGQYLFKINSIGKGPGEYITPKDFWLDTISNNLIIYDYKLKKLLRFNYDGVFLSEMKLNFNSTGTFAFIPPDTYLYDIDGAYNIANKNLISKKLLITADHSSTVSSYFYTNININNFISPDFKFYPSKEGIKYIPRLSDTIYNITINSIEPRYYVNFGDFRVKSPIKEQEIKAIYSISAFNIHNYVENDNLLFFNFLYKPVDQRNNVLYSKKSKLNIYFTKIIANASTIGLSYPIAATSDEFIFLIEPHTLLQQINMYKNSNNVMYDKAIETFGSVFMTISNKSNPILMFCEINI